MAGQRGLNAYREQANAQKERRAGGFADILLMKGGDTVRGRFRGLMDMPAQVLTEKQIRALNADWQEYVLASLGVAMPDGGKIEDVVKAVLTRYKQVEPFIIQQHTVYGLKGRDAYSWCVKDYNGGNCVDCYMKAKGDDRMRMRTQSAFTFQPMRKIHVIEGGAKKQYLVCPAMEGEACVHCNAGNEAKWETCRYLSLANTHVEGVVACWERVKKRCAACAGVGQIRRVGWQCSNPDCGEPLAGWQPPAATDNPGPDFGMATCPECAAKMRPEETLKCSRNCEAPRRCQLYDVDVLVQRIGNDKTTSYQFTEQFPCEPLPPELLKRGLPNYELALKPKSTEERCRALGLTQNPFGGGAVSAPPQEQTTGYDESDAEGAGDPYGDGAEGKSGGNDGSNIPW